MARKSITPFLSALLLTLPFFFLTMAAAQQSAIEEAETSGSVGSEPLSAKLSLGRRMLSDGEGGRNLLSFGVCCQPGCRIIPFFCEPEDLFGARTLGRRLMSIGDWGKVCCGPECVFKPFWCPPPGTGCEFGGECN